MARSRKSRKRMQEKIHEKIQQEEVKQDPLKYLTDEEALEVYTLIKCIHFVENLPAASVRFLAGYLLSLYFKATNFEDFKAILGTLQDFSKNAATRTPDSELRKWNSELSKSLVQFIHELENFTPEALAELLQNPAKGLDKAYIE